MLQVFDDPERAGRDEEPEAVDRQRADQEHRREQRRVADADAPFEPADAVREHERSRDDVHRPPDPHLAHADEELRVLRLRQCEVELAVAYLFHQALHVRLDAHLDQAAEQDLDPHHDLQLRLAPPVQLVRVRVDELQHDERRPDSDNGLEQLDEEVRAVLQLGQRPELEVQPREAERSQFPTAE